MSYPRITPLKQRRTKIVATLGPASREPAMVDGLIAAGVDVFRLNFSHGTFAEHRTVYERVRTAAQKAGRPIAILADLCGPKMRVGTFPGGSIELIQGSTVAVTVRDVAGQPGLIPSQYHALADDVQPGNRILLDDGLLELRVEEVQGTEIRCSVIYGGILKDRKGMNLPGVNVSAPALTEKDKEAARFVLGLGTDMLALSFVRRASDVQELRALVTGEGSTADIIAKIEKPEALEEIDAILDAADGIMVARGDLGVELPPEQVPIAQMHLVTHARAKSKPVIVATQMLESMIEHPRPTRAEVSDVSGAVFRGADAVMLSAETASGAYPLLAVGMMNRIARAVEGFQWTDGAFRGLADDQVLPEPLPLNAAFARSTAQLSRELRVRAIVVLSRSGTTAAVMAGARPAAPLLAVSNDLSACRRMNLLWGVFPIYVDDDQFRHPHALARRLAQDYTQAGQDQYVLLVAGFRRDATANEPVVTVLRL